MLWIGNWLAATLALWGPAPRPTQDTGGACRAPAAREFPINVGASLTDTAVCGAYILSTDASMNGAFSWGEMAWPVAVEGPFEVQLRWRRLSADASRPLELHTPGGGLLLGDGKVGFYESNAQFAADGGYQDLAGYDGAAEHTLRIEQRSGEMRVWVDGTPLPMHPWSVKADTGRVMLALKGERGQRSRVLVRSFWVRPLPQSPGLSQ